jgi:hypothetical protein
MKSAVNYLSVAKLPPVVKYYPNITPQSPVKAMQPSLESLLSQELSHFTAQLHFLANLPLLGSARGSSLQICICPLMLGSLQSKYP